MIFTNCLTEMINRIIDSERPEDIAAAIEFVFEGMHLNKRLNKSKSRGKTVYRM